MNLVIRAITLNDRPLTQAIDGCFDARGGTIGRSEGNTMALPDPERHISRLQAQVVAEGARFFIRNAGSANPILVNGQSLAPGERAALAHDDELRIGGYVLGVALAADREAHTIAAAPAAAKAGPAAGAAAAAALSSANPFADLMAEAGSAAAGSAVDPFAFLSEGEAHAAPAPAAPGRPVSAPTAEAPWPIESPTAPPPSARLPDDFDPFADLAAPSTDEPAALRIPNKSGEQDLLASVGASPGQSASVDSLFGLGTTPQAGDDALAAFMQAGPPSAADEAAAAVATDPLALFGADHPRANPAGARAAAFDHTPELAAAYTPPRILDATSRGAPPAARPAEPAPAPATGAEVRLLWAAFCEGAGVDASLARADAAQMRVLGQVLREAVEGTLRLVTIRATAKQELRAATTTIRGRNNNPLKFAPDAQLAMEQLMQPPVRGFMPAPAAMQDAMHDLVGHGIGTMAGMRAALAGVLERFQPQQLEAKLADKSMLDSLLAMNRKAKLWDLYLQHFETIRGEAQDDFHTLFGKAFVAAYEEQLDRLQRRSEAA
ncbi:MAG TPA: type VI secretion system-associated FHA domain protein TagH [Albitalea sp.]